MPNITIEAKKLKGEIVPPPDKSISHRAIIISSIAEGETEVQNLSQCDDCLRTLEALGNMGVAINKTKDGYTIQGKGLRGLTQPKNELFLGNSGTSMRLLLGVLSAQSFSCRLTGDQSLSRRPMRRVTQPLSLMGAKIKGRDGSEFAPLTIQGQAVEPIKYALPVASAQVKSAILLAGLYAQGKTEVIEPVQSRDHTERMLKKFGADVSLSKLTISVTGEAKLKPQNLLVPADISAASFFLVAASICKDSQVHIRSVGLNPTRIAALKVLQQMGAQVNWKQPAEQDYTSEPIGEITAKYSPLQSITIRAEQIASLIDELPILMVAATQAEGETKILGAGELRVKETDRISSMVTNLQKLGADIESSENDIIIRGPSKLKAAQVDSFGDHRTAMSMAVAALVASGRTTITNADCVNISFPGFFEILARLQR